MTPDHVVAQRDQARAKANHIRISMARFKHECRCCNTSEAAAMVADLLTNPQPGDLAAMRVGQLLQAIPRIGSVRVNRFLRRAMIVSSDRPLRMISLRQRLVLAEAVREFSANWVHEVDEA